LLSKEANGFGRQFMEAGERRRGVKAPLLLYFYPDKTMITIRAYPCNHYPALPGNRKLERTHKK